MDIQGWLQGTADRAPPNPSDEPDAPASIQPAHGIEATTATRYRRKRRRAASDSSLIALQPRRDRQGREGDHSAQTARAGHVKRPSSRSGSASRYSLRHLAAREDSQSGPEERPEPNIYERRARHKTKPDRYEPKPRKTKEKKQRNEKNGRTKRKSTRTLRGGDGKRTESLIQGFRLQNRPSDSRLTLKPDVSAGIFRHGRTSAQTTGRNSGLPDLAFNEMKFLRDFNKHQDQQQEHESPRKPNHQQKKREAERQEVSAYFNERASHEQPRGSLLNGRQARKHSLPENLGLPTHNDRVGQEGSSPMLQGEELPAIPYLGFGSKGTANQSGNPHPSTTSYLTWSESVPGQVPPGAKTNDTKAARKPARLPVPQRTQTQHRHRHAAVITRSNSERHVIQNTHQGTQGHLEKSRSTKGSAAVEVHVAPDISEHQPSTGMRRVCDTTSLSLPTAPPKMSQLRQYEMNAHGHPLSDAGSFHTSDILKVRGRLIALAEPPQSDAQSDLVRQSDKENLGPSTSPMAKVLRMAQGAMMQNQLETVARPPTVTYQADNHFVIAEHENSHYSHAPFRHEMARPRLHNLAHMNKAIVRPPTATRPNDRPGITQHDDLHGPQAPFQLQMARPHLQSLAHHEYAHSPILPSTSLRSRYIDQQLRQDDQDHHSDYVNPDDGDMLDDYSPAKQRFGKFASSTGEPTYSFAFTAHAQSDLHSLPFRNDRPSTRMRGTPRSRGNVSITLRDTQSHYMSAEQQDMASREDHDAGGLALDDGFEGFWRPNRLY